MKTSWTSLLRTPQKTNVSKKHAVRRLCFDDGRPVLRGLFRGLSGEVTGWRWNLTTCNQRKLTCDYPPWHYPLVNYNMTTVAGKSTFFSIGDTSSLLVHFLLPLVRLPEGLPCCSWKWMAKEVGRWRLAFGKARPSFSPQSIPRCFCETKDDDFESEDCYHPRSPLMDFWMNKWENPLG